MVAPRSIPIPNAEGPSPWAARVEAPPRQARSRRTLESILDAAERLLRERPWEQISIADVMREAGCSNGAIYGRFKTKDELLLALYRRHDARLRARHPPGTSRRHRPGDTLETFARRELTRLVDRMRADRWLLRAVGLLSRVRPEVVDGAMFDERRAILDRIGQGILAFRDEIGHPDPERAVERMVFSTNIIASEALLYQGPLARAVDMSRRELIDHLVDLALRSLHARPPAHESESGA